ncbi:MAG: spermidine synthase [Candidatus Xenobia bacterium]
MDPAVVDVGLRYFQPDDLLVKARRSGRWRLVIDDARHFLRTDRTKYDFIGTDLLPPVTLQLGALHTQEFYRMCARHLNPDGVFSTFLSDPLVSADPRISQSVAVTARSVFSSFVLVNPMFGLPSFFYGATSPNVLQPRLVQIALMKFRQGGFLSRPDVLPKNLPPLTLDHMPSVVLANEFATRRYRPAQRPAGP